MIPEIEQTIRSVTMEGCNKLARKVLTVDYERQISAYLRNKDPAGSILVMLVNATRAFRTQEGGWPYSEFYLRI